MEELTPSYEGKLRYWQGWREILEAPDTEDYRMWLRSLTDLTKQRLSELGSPLADDDQEIGLRWMQAAEIIGDTAVDPDDQLTEPERIETALLTLQANIESIGWSEPGLTFPVPDRLTGKEALIDLRNLPGSSAGQ